ncbi:hypothetical protein [Nitrospirillum sp. BR 11163]|uniref:hypothetical protein n=1 Tax=Nitrospirillum sp. BR 11163 TaxID=3104323 RepID=UPI002AFFA156|nr:hypothetical protein [Nitrospirillum sp. BR 11163]MEA1672458.1 hypothetical protein [Nitrospirillum sp. BR 11163]
MAIDTIVNIAALRANTVAFTSVQTLGYHTVGDGGEGIYVLNSGDTSSGDNGGSIIVDAAGHRWYLSNLRTPTARQFGAYGDNSHDDTSAFINASNWLAALGGGTLVVEQGTYLIANSLTLACAMAPTQGAKLAIAGGKTLALNGSIDAGLYQIITGAGASTFGPAVGVAYPEWFGAATGGDDAAPTQACLAACVANKVGLHFSQTMRFANTVTITAAVPITSNSGVNVLPTGGFTGDAFRITAFEGACEMRLPAILNFTVGTGLRLQGTTLTRVYVPLIQNCLEGVVLETKAAAGYTSCLDNTIIFEVITGCQNAISFAADNNGNVMQGNLLQGNFITGVRNAVIFNAPGLVPNWDSNSFIFQAVDGNQASFTGLQNNSSGQVPRVTFEVRDWYGGFWADGSGGAINGSFNGLKFYANFAQEPWLYSQFNVFNSVNCRYDVNYRQSNLVAAATSPNSRGSFNGGAPLMQNRFLLNMTLPGDLGVGAYQSFYCYSPFIDGGSFNYSAVPFNMQGAIINAIVTTGGQSELQITVRNVGPNTLSAGLSVQVAVTVGTA